MSERTSYKPGTPCWVDLGSPDLDAAVEFYGGLFGWEVPEPENSEQTGGYRRATKDGKDVAGMMPLMQEGQPPAWTTYVSVEDAEATAAEVREAGGSVMAEPMDVMDLGRWRSSPTRPAPSSASGSRAPSPAPGRVNEPGALRLERARHPRPRCRQEPSTAPSSAGASKTQEMGEMGTYTEWKLGEDRCRRHDGHARPGARRGARPLARLLRGRGHRRGGRDSQELGRRGHLGPIDIPAGRFAVVSDPTAPCFAVIRMPERGGAGLEHRRG